MPEELKEVEVAEETPVEKKPIGEVVKTSISAVLVAAAAVISPIINDNVQADKIDREAKHYVSVSQPFTQVDVVRDTLGEVVVEKSTGDTLTYDRKGELPAGEKMNPLFYFDSSWTITTVVSAHCIRDGKDFDTTFAIQKMKGSSDTTYLYETWPHLVPTVRP